MAKATITRARQRWEVDAANKANFRDALTNQEPIHWRGNALQIDVAVCLSLDNFQLTDDSQLVDLTASGFESVTMEVKSKADPTVSNLMAKTVSSFDNTLTAALWAAGANQNLSFLFSDEETNIGAGTYFVVVSALTAAGPITLGVSSFTVVEDGTPADVPDPQSNPGSAISLAQADARYALLATPKYRVKATGELQIYNADQSKFHTLSISGAAGAEVLNIGAGEA